MKYTFLGNKLQFDNKFNKKNLKFSISDPPTDNFFEKSVFLWWFGPYKRKTETRCDLAVFYNHPMAPCYLPGQFSVIIGTHMCDEPSQVASNGQKIALGVCFKLCGIVYFCCSFKINPLRIGMFS